MNIDKNWNPYDFNEFGKPQKIEIDVLFRNEWLCIDKDAFERIKPLIKNERERNKFIKEFTSKYEKEAKKRQRFIDKARKEHEKYIAYMNETEEEQEARITEEKRKRRERKKQKILEEIHDLCVNLNLMDKRYEMGFSTVDDHIYDSSLAQLEYLIDLVCRNYPDECKKEDFIHSPTQRLSCSSLSEERKTIQHKLSMLSIKNALTIEQLDQFLCKKIINSYGDECALDDSMETVIISPKVDGVACSLMYEDGKLKYAVTRGNGVVGEDITTHVRTMRTVPLAIGTKGILEVRGEIYMTRASFDYVNEMEKEKTESNNKVFIPFSNPRNLVAGTLNGDKPELCQERELQFIAHSRGYEVNKEFLSKYLTTSFTLYDWNGFNVVPYEEFTCRRNNLHILKEKILNMWKNIKELPYNCDGVVVAINDYKTRDQLKDSQTYVAWAIACKYMLDTATRTRLIKIEYTVGKTGKVTPIAWFEPVEIAGSVVQKASLGSKETVEALDLYENDIIQVSKAGGIIPHVDKAITESRSSNQKFVFPKCCPVCGTELECYGKKTYFCPACKQE